MSATKVSTVREVESFSGILVEGVDAARRELDSLAGLRVAVVGSGVQLAPLLGRLSNSAGTTKVFHTEPAWVLPGAAAVLGRGRCRLTGAAPPQLHDRATELVATTHLRWWVRDPWTRRQLTPTSPPNGSNVACSDSYLRALRRVELVLWPVTGACLRGLRTADGIEHHVDAVVLL